MNKRALIRVKGIQEDADNQKNTIELITEGTFYKKGNFYYITYDESEITGLEGTTTTLKVSKDKVTLIRFGKNNVRFIFEENKKHRSNYATPFGDFEMDVTSKEINVNLTDNGGELYINYRLDMEGEFLSQNQIHISVKEAGGWKI